MEYIYFKRPDGSILGKQCKDKYKLRIPKERYDAYLESGCVRCNEKGELLVSSPKEKSKKK